MSAKSEVCRRKSGRVLKNAEKSMRGLGCREKRKAEGAGDGDTSVEVRGTRSARVNRVCPNIYGLQEPSGTGIR